MIHFRKILTGALASFLAAASVAFPAPVKADEFDISTIYEPYFMVSDADNPTVALDGLEKDADLRVFPASTTKVLSCIVAIEQTEQNGKSFSDMVSVSANAVDFGRGNSLMGLEEGDSYSLEDLLYGMMLPSGNDAAIAIAEHIAGSTKAFAALMNAKAQQLGMTSSHFVTVHGKHNDDHYTTVRDMAKLTAYALKNEMFCKIVSTATYTAESGPRAIELVNSNRMLIDTPPTEKLQNPISCLYENCIGVKTGDTTQAGKCLIAAARKEGITLIAILYGGTLGDSSYDAGASDSRRDPYNAYRFQDAKRLFEYEFNKMERSVTLQELKQSGLQTEFEIRVPNAIIDDPNGGILTVRADLADSMTMNLMEPKLRAILDNAATLAETSITNSYAPIADGSVVGRVSYVYNGETLFSADLLATRSVKEGMAQVNMTTDAPQAISGGLIGDVNRPNAVSEEPESTVGCGNLQLSGKQLILWILLPIILLLLIVCLIMFALYLRAERIKRERRAARKRAKQRAKQSQRY